MLPKSESQNRRQLSIPLAIAIALLGLLSIFLRTVFLDADPPPPWIVWSTTIDELHYPILALDLAQFGELFHRVWPITRNEAGPYAIVLNAFTYWSLEAFGNNYFGLRLGTALAAVLAITLTTVALWNSTKERRRLTAFSLAFLVCHFPFVVYSRSVNPTLFETLSAAIGLFLSSEVIQKRCPEGSIPTLAFGFLTGCMPLFVYTYDAYIVAAAFAATTVWYWLRRPAVVLRHMATFAAGVGLAAGAYALVIRVIFKMTLSDFLREQSDGYSGRFIGAGEAFGERLRMIFSAIKNLLVPFFYGSNVFTYNRLLFFMFVVTFPFTAARALQRRCLFDLMVTFSVIFFALQLMVGGILPYEKILMCLPIVIASIVLGLEYIGEKYSTIRRASIQVSFVLALSVVVAFIAAYLPTLEGASLTSFKKLPAADMTLINLSTWISISGFAGVLLIAAFRRQMATINSAILPFAVLGLVLPNAFFVGKYILASRSYSIRDQLASLSPLLDDKVVTMGGFLDDAPLAEASAASFPFGFRLYNRSIPSFNWYRYYGRRLEQVALQQKIFAADAADFATGLYSTPSWINELRYHRLMVRSVEYLPEVTFAIFGSKIIGFEQMAAVAAATGGQDLDAFLYYGAYLRDLDPRAYGAVVERYISYLVSLENPILHRQCAASLSSACKRRECLLPMVDFYIGLISDSNRTLLKNRLSEACLQGIESEFVR